MKRVAVFMGVAFATCTLLSVDAFSQKKKKAPARKTNTNRAAVAPPPVVETPPPVDSAAIYALNDSLTRANMIPKATPSKRPTTTVVGDLVNDKTPLAYDNIRVDDVVYKQVVLKDISVMERINATFRYAGEDDNGSQNFFYILLGHIRDGDLTAFDAVNDRFTTPLTLPEVSRSLGTSTSSMDVPDLDKDPTGTLGIVKTVIITEEFNINSIVGYRIKQEILFDRETSRMHFRTLGIAPLMDKDIAGQKVSVPMFWVYYPEARPFLAKHEAYNPRNMAMRMSWEEVFESRFYAGTIYKSTMSNSGDLPLRAIVKDPLLRLREGDNINNAIFNWEQDQWSY